MILRIRILVNRKILRIFSKQNDNLRKLLRKRVILCKYRPTLYLCHAYKDRFMTINEDKEEFVCISLVICIWVAFDKETHGYLCLSGSLLYVGHTCFISESYLYILLGIFLLE